MIDQCQHCRLDTGGNHEYTCPLNLNIHEKVEYLHPPTAPPPGVTTEHPLWEIRAKELLKEKDALEATCQQLKTQRVNLRNELDRLLAVVGKEDYELIVKCLEENESI